MNKFSNWPYKCTQRKYITILPKSNSIQLDWLMGIYLSVSKLTTLVRCPSKRIIIITLNSVMFLDHCHKFDGFRKSLKMPKFNIYEIHHYLRGSGRGNVWWFIAKGDINHLGIQLIIEEPNLLILKKRKFEMKSRRSWDTY